jgi:uncharacterized protein with PQ loop repeat
VGVAAMDVESIIKYAGPLTFLGLQCSTLSTGYKIWTHKSVFHYNIVPFFTLFVNCVVWGIYGFLIDEFPIYGYEIFLQIFQRPNFSSFLRHLFLLAPIRPNISGAVVGFLCTLAYQRYSPTRDMAMYLLGSIVVIASVVAGYLDNAQVVGGIGSILSVALMAAPLSVVTTVISERSTDALPFTSRSLFFLFLILRLHDCFPLTLPQSSPLDCLTLLDSLWLDLSPRPFDLHS